jgi:hypothetical protein
MEQHHLLPWPNKRNSLYDVSPPRSINASRGKKGFFDHWCERRGGHKKKQGTPQETRKVPSSIPQQGNPAIMAFNRL